jgi:hypothetical protein
MFCPKCATQNVDNAKFCRACGSDISLVPAALSGRRPEVPAVVDEEDEIDSRSSRRRRRRSKKPVTYGKAFENLGVGFAFLIISIVVMNAVPSGKFWWFWLLIPTFACFGEGIGQLMQLRKELPGGAAAPLSQPELSSTHTAGDLPPRSTSEIMAPPPSVTEGTTRHLGAERER